MYFSSPEECNDPFDSKTFYVFDNNKDKWTKLLKFSLEQTNATISKDFLQIMVDFLCASCPLTFDTAANSNFLEDFPSKTVEQSALVNFIAVRIKAILAIYKPPTKYFASFSKLNSESLMWSHYANKHTGFCLIFKAIDGELKLSPKFKKDQIIRKTPNGIANEMSYTLPESFKFKDIEYKRDVESLDAFLHMPVAVTGDVSNQREAGKLSTQRESHYLQKGQSWFYESETRLTLPPPPPWLFGEQITYSRQERLFHYEPSQLAGIIYGARISIEDKIRIQEILKERKNFINEVSNYSRTVFNFVEFEAKLSTNQRQLNIEPISLNGKPTIDKDFKRLYKEWQEGYGYKRENSSSRLIQVK